MLHFDDSTDAVPETKSTRKELRMKPGVAAKIKGVANMVGMDESTFITSAAFQKAQEIEQSQFVSILPQEQFDVFASAVEAKGERNEALAEVLKQGRETFVDA